MKMQQNTQEYLFLEQFCKEIKEKISLSPIGCKEKVMEMLKEYPDAPQPQNLLGVLAEKDNDKALAMKHYRAAWALAPYYRPSRHNIDRLVEENNTERCLFNDQDVDDLEKQKDKHIMRRSLI